MKRVYSILVLLIPFLLLASIVDAKFSSKMMNAVMSTYPAALPQKALESAFEQPDPEKMRGYVVLEKGGIAAEQARHFISWQEYDYRGVTVNVADGGIKTRRGRPYTYLQRGDVMAVAGVKFFHNTIYLRLLSADVYVPENKRREKHHSRVTVMLGFKFSKEELKAGDVKGMLSEIKAWAKPFMNESDAKNYASGLRGAGVASGGEVATVPSTSKNDDERMKSLEEKINSARKQMEEAEAEMNAIKKDRKK